MRTNIAERIRAIRTERGISATALSIRAGLSHAVVGHIEAGRTKDPGVGTLIALAVALEVPLDWLATGNSQYTETVIDGIEPSPEDGE